MRSQLVLIASVAVLAAGTATADNWPSWRGPSRNSVSNETGLPVTWGAKCTVASAPANQNGGQAGGRATGRGGGNRGGRGGTGGRGNNLVAQGRGGRGGGQRGGGNFGGGLEGRPITPLGCAEFDEQNVAWKLPLPAYSGSTPIVWGDMIFLNVATQSNSGTLELWAVDRKTQTVAWKRPLANNNHMERKQNMSTPSPVTDGQHVWVMTGVGALKAFDFAGKEIWARSIQDDYGPFGLNWGYASSPLLQGNALYLQVLHGMKTDDPSYLLKIDKMTGKTIWRVERHTNAIDESPDSYTTPTWIEANGRAELIITGGDVISGHSPDTGQEYWRADVLNPTNDRSYRLIASPTAVGDLIIAPSRNNPLTAIRPGGRGDVARSHIVWQFAQGPDVPTPVSDGELLYIVRDNGVVFALDVKTGKTVYGPQRLPSGTYSASPVLADGKIYVTTEDTGLTSVFRSGPRFELLSSNSLADDCSPYCLSTVAVSEGQLFLRTASYLWVVGERKGK